MSAACVAEAPASSTQAKPATAFARRVGKRSADALSGRALAIVSSSVLLLGSHLAWPGVARNRPPRLLSPRGEHTQTWLGSAGFEPVNQFRAAASAGSPA